MVIQAGSNTGTIDPVHGNVSKTPSDLVRVGDVITVVANTLTATIRVGSEPLSINRDWVFAHGRVYWTNGVFDSVYFDTSIILQKPKTLLLGRDRKSVLVREIELSY